MARRRKKSDDKTEDICRLKEAIREQLSKAAANTELNGYDLLGALVAVGAESVALVDNDSLRQSFIDTVVMNFADCVTLARKMPEGIVLQ